MGDIEGVIFVAQTLSEGVRMLVRYPPLKRNAVASETMRAFLQETTAAPQQPTTTSSTAATATTTTAPAPPSGTSSVPSPAPTSPAPALKLSRWDFRAASASPVGQRLRLEAAREHTKAYDMSSVVIAPLFMPRSPLLNKPLTVAVDDSLFVGYPLTISAAMHSSSGASATGTAADVMDAAPLSKSDVVAIAVMYAVARGRDDIVAPLQRVSRNVALALRHEEERCRWLSSEVTKMTTAREMWLRAQQIADATPGALRPDMFDLTEYLLQVSPLCVALTDTFRRLRLAGSAQLCFNGWTSLSVSLWSPSVPLHPPLRPYHTLLLTDHELADIAQRCSPPMALFLSAARPSKSFRDLQRETGLTLRHLYQLASHLVYWRGATVATVLAQDTVCVVNPRPLVPIFANAGSLASKFAADCPAVAKLVASHQVATKGTSSSSSSSSSLVALLNLFTVARTLEDHLAFLSSSATLSAATIELQSRVFIQAVCWLLAHDLLVQLHYHVYLAVPADRVRERFANFHTPLYNLLRLLLPLFERGCNLEEIKWRANVSTNDIEELIRRFPGILVRVIHESQ